MPSRTPSSDLEREIDYIENVLSGTKVSSATDDAGNKVYTGKLFAGDNIEQRWVQSATSTQGPMTVAAWEKYAAAVHAGCIACPNPHNQGFDRLADNHIGGHATTGTATLDGYIKAQQAKKLPYRMYGVPGGRMQFLYMYGPNGWGYQIIGSCSDTSLCGDNIVNYDMCTQGGRVHRVLAPACMVCAVERGASANSLDE